MTVHDDNKQRVSGFRRALFAGDAAGARAALLDLFHPGAAIRLGLPFGVIEGPEALWDQVYAPMFAALSDLERQDWVVIAGPRWGVEGGDWVGLGGHFIGTLRRPWLGIPAHGAPVHMRYHEYLRFVDGQVVEMQGLWDIASVMMQAGCWPMAPQLGVDWMVPGPVDGLRLATDPKAGAASVQRVWDMLHDLKEGTAKTPERGLGGFWHANAMWYGPAGLGTARGHDGIAQRIFRGFREGLSQNTRHLEEGVFFGDGDLVAFTGWPSGTAVHSGDGFLGLGPTGRTVTRASLDFWQVQAGQIRACWVMVDVLDLYRQMGVDVFSRMERLAA